MKNFLEEETTMTEGRYSRQEMILGWDQKKWGSMSAVVIGDDLLGQQVLENLVATGLGDILFIGEKKNSAEKKGYYPNTSRDSMSDSAVDFLKKVNPEIKIDFLDWPLRRKSLEIFLEKADLLFETTNDPQTKGMLCAYAKEKRKILIYGSAEKYRGALASGKNQEYISEMQELQGSQGIIPSMIIGGMMVEEARKSCMPYAAEESKTLKTLFWYNLFSKERFEKQNDFHATVQLSGKSIVSVGAGALATPCLTALLLEGADDIHIIDYDIPSTSNLSRQIFYYDAQGRPKALVLSEKLGVIRPKAKIRALNAKLVEEKEEGYECITPEQIKGLSPELIVSCLDNFEARLILNKMGMPLVHGGTSFRSAKSSLSIPGKTLCPDCLFGFSLFAAEEKKRDSCDAVPEPSIISTSKICAALMAGEAVLYLSGAGEHINGYIAYDVFEASRAQVIKKTNICNHTEKEK
ncbi:MAG TPA: hypothetical protein HA233_03850 [Nanoarchaeota archaeon]|nr:hypothetical protein [Nanoarchaeota archaeon]